MTIDTTEMAGTRTNTILVVDDDAALRTAVSEVLSAHEYRAVACAGAEEALERLQADGADVVVTDLRMPGMKGEALLQEVRRTFPEVGFLQDRISMFDLKLGAEVLTEAKRELIELYQKERLMLAKIAKAAVDAGIAQERVQLEREKGVKLVEVLREVFDGLGLSIEQQRLLPILVPAALRKLTEPQTAMQLEQPKQLNGG